MQALKINEIAKSLLETARSVITIEAEMVARLQDRLGPDFIDACSHLFQCQGRIAVTGVGKSGHISRKIAATFASTGSPAFFIHPSEAKHGDAGMITNKDVVLALSYSGESEEVLAILPYIKRLSIPLIAMTGNPESTLAKAATIHLDASIEKEACPLGLAPTSSTTVSLVLGDALAMALLTQRGFTKSDFALSHPGGTLGRRLLLRVQDLMHQGEALPLVNTSTSFKDALVEMTQKKLGTTTVVNETGVLVGILTDGDIRRAFDKQTNLHDMSVHAVMSKNPKTITSDLLAAEALNIMQAFKITSLVVTTAKQEPVGIIHIHDLLKAGVV
ncbi:MAG TPA: KpsF/GutQ family sugar-phosphate isomerase [Gammaproteobacteria bacterium]|nr:KpsF/GutQ family sugar-phosphate isomerase [Gammaproteobacteria bacterium]